MSGVINVNVTRRLDRAFKGPLYDDDTFLGLNCTKIWAAAECRLMKECSEPVYAHQNITYVKDWDIYATMGKSASSVGRYLEVTDEMDEEVESPGVGMTKTVYYRLAGRHARIPVHHCYEEPCETVFRGQLTCGFSWMCSEVSHSALSLGGGDYDGTLCQMLFVLETHEEQRSCVFGKVVGVFRTEPLIYHMLSVLWGSANLWGLREKEKVLVLPRTASALPTKSKVHDESLIGACYLLQYKYKRTQ
ncbi:hypothetical protein K438DRAFT_1785288 [Mycena galopus ATCC 62051]|nr:hypothetical protein K438DRAFT_1785288 [Mycena galopus ATCC 62051]